MAIGKHTSLEEAQKEKKLDRYAKAHSSTGDRGAFDVRQGDNSLSAFGRKRIWVINPSF